MRKLQKATKIVTKKSLGQHFLRDPKILKKIVDFARLEPEDTVVEIGPGEGGLTKILLERVSKVIAVEKDRDLVEKLKQNFCQEIKDLRFKILEGDILKLPEISSAVFSERKWAKPAREISGNFNYKLVGNIPYYITGEIFKKFLESPPAGGPPKSITFVVQKEVAERIMGSHFAEASRNKKESILSISVKVFGDPEYGGIIKAGSFYPKPKVDSAIIAVRNIGKGKLHNGKMKNFFHILKKGFAHKRKLLIRNLGTSEEIFTKLDIPLKARAEDLKVEDWILLTKILATNY